MLVLEDISDMDDLTKDELYGILTTYEIRTEPENVYMKEVAFKATCVRIINPPLSNLVICLNKESCLNRESIQSIFSH